MPVVETLSALERLAADLTTIERLGLTGGAVLGVLIVSWIAPRVRSVLERQIRPTLADLTTSVSVAVAVALASGAILAIWGQLGRVGEAIQEASPTGTLIPELVLTLSIAVAAYVMTGFLRRVIDDLLAEHEGVSDHQREVLFRTTQLSLYVVAIAVVLGIWQQDLSGLLIGAGFLGVIVGLAARETLSSTIAGFVLMFSRPFEIGDWVVVGADGGANGVVAEGIVTDITIVNTRVQSFDGEYVMIPNDVVGSTEIINRTRKGRLRVEVEVGVDYEADLDRAVAIAEDAMRGVDHTLSVPAPEVVVKSFGDSAIMLGLRFWIDDPSSRRRWRARTAVIRSITAAFRREGIKIPFPQRELTGRAETGGFRLADVERTARGSMEERPPADRDGSTSDESGSTTDDGAPRESPADERHAAPDGDS